VTILTFLHGYMMSTKRLLISTMSLFLKDSRDMLQKKLLMISKIYSIMKKLKILLTISLERRVNWKESVTRLMIFRT